MMATTIDNYQDYLDVRDVIARVEELESTIKAATDRMGEYPNAEIAECGNCGRSFPDVFPSARCPYEYEHDEIAELAVLTELLDDLKGNGGDEQWKGDWYPIGLIRDSYFKDYAMQLAEDIGAIPDDASWPARCIDWDQAAWELRMDYTSVEFDGITYWYR